MSDQRSSDCEQSKRDIPSFIEPRPPLILHPFMRPKPQKGTNLLEQFEEDSECEEPELVQVYLRLKPCNVRSNLYEVKSDRCLITSVDTAPMGHGRRTQHHVSKMYTFSHIFGPECNQKEIFEQVVKENLKKLPDGHNFTLLTYGASGSGKTYTLMGTVQSPGLVPRSLEYVFRVVDAAQQPLYKPVDGDAVKLDYYEQDLEMQVGRRLRQVSAPLRDKYRRMSAHLRSDLTASTFDLASRTRYFVWVSFVEIYNESIYDLLSNSDRSKATSKLRIREDSNGHVYVKGATQAFVRTGEEAYDVMVAGKHNLQVAATGVHANSSRSHCIFTITMLTETDDGVRTSCVRLCDLAGCERQRHTKNTGARMQESRAINSSLHVLERCLHMLRRKQKKFDATLVPYRESKLTRLLGAGLSGARGEAVSMVVTLTPAPERAHETKHVLQLAAVAKDIQVNQTIQESTLESSTQDSTLATTISCSGDVMRLRAENERLHFELVQAQHRNKELMAAMEEKQAETAKTMFEIVEEAKDMTRQYYEAQLQALRTEMEEMQDEYESRLKEAALEASEKPKLSIETETPSKSLQKKVAALLTEIAILEEKLTAEKLARARAEQEVQHLRACIEERDEKAEQDSGQHEEVMSVTDESESEEEEDSYNESLEPTFKKEDINRSKLLQQSLMNESKHDTTINDEDTINKEDSINNESSINNHTDIHDDKNETLKDESREDSVKDSTYCSEESNVTEKSRQTQDVVMNDSAIDISNNYKSLLEAAKYADGNDVTKELNNAKSCAVRGTYFVRDDMPVSNGDAKVAEPTELDISNDVSSLSNSNQSASESMDVADNVPTSKDEAKPTSPEIINDLSSLRNDKESKPLNAEESFEENEKIVEHSIEQKSVNTENAAIKRQMFNKKSTISHQSDVSLVNFEQLEIASKSPAKPKLLETFAEIKNLKEKRNYFDDENDPNDLIPKLSKSSKIPYFDNINVDTNKNLAVVKSLLKEDRSPSIVKEDIDNNFEPSTITKLLGQSFSRQPDRLSAVATISLPKKQASVDIFEGFDSPKVFTAKAIHRKDEDSHILSTSQMEEIKYIDQSSEPETANSTKAVITTNSLSNDESNIFVKPKDIKPNLATLEKSLRQQKHNDSLFDYCIEKKTIHVSQDKFDIVGDTCRSIKNMCLKVESDHKNEISGVQIKLERPSVEPEYNNTSSSKENEQQSDSLNYNNSAEYFDNVYKDITPRATEFELLISQNNTNISELKDTEKPKYNLRHTKANTSVEEKQTTVTIKNVNDKEKSVHNKAKDTSLNKKGDITNPDTSVDKTNSTIDKPDLVKNTSDEVLLESAAKCEGKKPKRNLRLRRRKNDDDKAEKENVKLKDIVNLQKEFSDVTLDVPVPVKEVKDIESPEKREEENRPPILGIQSCPSKSVTRSRRKLFTPRAEPLEESMAQSGDSNERIRVPRPSYHRTRARRKL